jgi:uncharacterized protein (DUF362 family)
MENTVGVVRGTEKLPSFRELLSLTAFDDVLLKAHDVSGKSKEDFKIVIKPNMMVFVTFDGHKALVTDKEMVEYLVDRILGLGFRDISVCEAQNDVGRMLKNHNVKFVAEKIGYDPKGRYSIVDLSLESEHFKYEYKGKDGKIRTWKDSVGKTWKNSDFRITFAKCKTHEHDWMTLGVKNVYGCFPDPNKVCRYHIRHEIFDVTARSLLNFPVHFSFIDGWVGSDGFQGYKIAHPQELEMLFGGDNLVAVDTEVFRRAGLDPSKSKILRKAIEQLYNGEPPKYEVRGDSDTRFNQLVKWENVDDDIVDRIDVLEEVYIAWAFINLKPGAMLIDYSIFPPKNIVYRFAVWVMKKVYAVFKGFRFYRQLYTRKDAMPEQRDER